jgi:hypothetical protein
VFLVESSVAAARGFVERLRMMLHLRTFSARHCEERSDEAIHLASFCVAEAGLLRFARNDG